MKSTTSLGVCCAPQAASELARAVAVILPTVYLVWLHPNAPGTARERNQRDSTPEKARERPVRFMRRMVELGQAALIASPRTCRMGVLVGTWELVTLRVSKAEADACGCFCFPSPPPSFPGEKTKRTKHKTSGGFVSAQRCGRLEVILVEVNRVQSSCGYSIPFFEYQGCLASELSNPGVRLGHGFGVRRATMEPRVVESRGLFNHFCDTRESPPLYGVVVFGKPFLLYHRSGHFPQP